MRANLSWHNCVPLIEGPTPAKIDWTLPGWPRLVLGAEAGQTLVLVNNLGRAVRLAVDTLRRTGSRVFAKQKTDEIIGGSNTVATDWLWLLSSEGYAKWVPSEQIPLAQETTAQNSSPQSTAIIRRRGEICAVIPATQARPLWAITSTRLLPLDPNATPRGEAESIAMHKTLSLSAGEQVLGVLNG